MRKVITFGVFDFFHVGHLALLEQAKACGDHLTVAVQEDDAVLAHKPGTRLFYPVSERIRLLKALRCVDAVCTYRDMGEDIQRMDFDVFAIGEDQTSASVQRAAAWSQEMGKEVVRMKYTEGVSSSLIKRAVGIEP